MKKVFLIFIIFLSLFLRIYHLQKVPPSLNWDEVSHGYNAYSILKTGKDEWGKTFPLIFRAYGDFKLPLYIYLTVMPVFLFGLNTFSVRLVSVFAGVGLVLLAYLITQKISKDKTTSLLAAFLTALSPWALFVSRVAVEANLCAFLFALGIFSFVCWQENKERKWLIWTVIPWGLAVYAYNSARVLVPLFFLLLTFVVLRQKRGKQLVLPGFFTLIFLLPLIFQFLNQSGSARYNLVSLVDQGVVNQIIEKRNNSKLPVIIGRIVYNRPSFFVFQATKNYLKNLSPRYLFFYGGDNYQFSLPDHELLYLVTAPFLLLGLIKLFLDKKNSGKILLLWFFSSFIPSAITKDAPHVLRTLLILPSPMIITAMGVVFLTDFLKDRSKFGGKLLIWVLIGTVLFSFGQWWKDYQTIYPSSYSWAWQYGYQQASDYIGKNLNDYDKIFFTKRYGEPHEFLLFYLNYSPQKYQNTQSKIWNYHANWYWVDSFDKFIFVNDWEVKNKVVCEENKTCLLITSPENYPVGWEKLSTIYFLNNQPSFEILKKSK